MFSAGRILLLGIILLISAPRSWSLYPLGVFLFTGLILWIFRFNETKKTFIEYWQFLLPPVVYFMVHVLSIMLNGGHIKLLENRLMFLLIPLLGVPLLLSIQKNIGTIKIFKYYISGLLVVSVFLIIRTIIVVSSGFESTHSLFTYLTENISHFFSDNFSVLEHPSYLAMKIVWIFILLLVLNDQLFQSRFVMITLLIFFSVMIFLLASRAAIILWTILAVYGIARIGRRMKMKIAFYIILVPSLIILTFFTVRSIERVEFFLLIMERGLKEEKVNWKNLDQRTREWYTAIQLIKEKPITGHGLAGVEDRLVKEYLSNGWEEEAALRLNAHNQFLEAQMTFGIAGTLSLLWMLLTPVIFRKKLQYPKLIVAFIPMISFFLMFESMFNRQWGIMFFMIFYFLLTKWTKAPDQSE